MQTVDVHLYNPIIWYMQNTRTATVHISIYSLSSAHHFKRQPTNFFVALRAELNRAAPDCLSVNAMQCVAIKVWNESKDISWYECWDLGKMVCYLLRGHWELLYGRLCYLLTLFLCWFLPWVRQKKNWAPAWKDGLSKENK